MPSGQEVWEMYLNSYADGSYEDFWKRLPLTECQEGSSRMAMVTERFYSMVTCLLYPAAVQYN